MLCALLNTTVLVVLYYLLHWTTCYHWTSRGDATTAARLLVGLSVFAGVMVWQIRTVAGSRYPAMRVLEALGVIVPVYVVLFASMYFLMERASVASLPSR